MVKSKIITFDDGYKSVFTKAYPYMKAKGLVGICFVVVGWIGNKDRMSLDELRELVDNGWEIGSHTLSHLSLPHIDPALAKIEIVESKKRLEQMGFDIKAFAYPFGRFNREIIEAVAQHYEWARSCDSSDGSVWTTKRGNGILQFHSIDKPEYPCNVSFEEFKAEVDKWIGI